MPIAARPAEGAVHPLIANVETEGSLGGRVIHRLIERDADDITGEDVLSVPARAKVNHARADGGETPSVVLLQHAALCILQAGLDASGVARRRVETLVGIEAVDGGVEPFARAR